MADKNDIKLQCVECGTDFIFSAAEQAYFEEHKLSIPKRCKACRKAKKDRYEKQKKLESDKIWQEQEAQRIGELLPKLPYQKLSRSELKRNDSGNVLFIIGNGFDIMHGVKSRYSDFRDSLGKNNELRQELELYLKTDSLWSNFEEALAYIDGGAMLGVVDMWLDTFDAYDPDAQAADYFAAIDAATEPASQMLDALPRRFRQWVETLKPEKEPLWLDILRKDDKYLNFNYTEFLETLYGIPSEQITYIHGCRKNKKQELILGHAPGASDDDDWMPNTCIPRYRSKRKAEMLEGALDTAARQIGWFDEGTTKKTDEVIHNHRHFFDTLNEITEVFVIGHSLSEVDYPYFQEILKCNNKANWTITWYSSNDLQNIQAFVENMRIKNNQITIVK